MKIVSTATIFYVKQMQNHLLFNLFSYTEKLLLQKKKKFELNERENVVQ